jgi:regulator of replication initiation timing
MSINTTEGIQSFPHDESRTVSEITESFTKAIDAPEEAIEPFAELVGDMAQTIEQQSEELSALREEKRELKDELKEERETRAKEAAQDRKRLHEVEERVDSVEEGGSPDTNPTPEAGQTTIQEPETPLEEIIRVPEHSVQEHLRANHQRARFVAKDVHEYTRSVPAGRVIKSSELRRVLSAHEEGATIHTQTVSRVIERLDDLGKESVKVRETQEGERVVVFTDEFVKRVVAYHNSNHSVVAHEEVEG